MKNEKNKEKELLKLSRKLVLTEDKLNWVSEEIQKNEDLMNVWEDIAEEKAVYKQRFNYYKKYWVRLQKKQLDIKEQIEIIKKVINGNS